MEKGNERGRKKGNILRAMLSLILPSEAADFERTPKNRHSVEYSGPDANDPRLLAYVDRQLTKLAIKEG